MKKTPTPVLTLSLQFEQSSGPSLNLPSLSAENIGVETITVEPSTQQQNQEVEIEYQNETQLSGIVMEELTASDLKRMKNRPNVPNLSRIQGLKAIALEQRKMLTGPKQIMEEDLDNEKTSLTEDGLDTEAYFRACYSPNSYWREDLYPSPCKVSPSTDREGVKMVRQKAWKSNKLRLTPLSRKVGRWLRKKE